MEKVSIHLFGDADRWPFDVFSTGTISADVVAGSGESRRFVPARAGGGRVAQRLEHQQPAPARGRRDRARRPQRHLTSAGLRAAGPVIAGFCLVLLALPAIALYVSIEMLLGRKAFQPAFHFFALDAVRGGPDPQCDAGQPARRVVGRRGDHRVVLIALVVATIIYVIAWARRAD